MVKYSQMRESDFAEGRTGFYGCESQILNMGKPDSADARDSYHILENWISMMREMGFTDERVVFQIGDEVWPGLFTGCRIFSM